MLCRRKCALSRRGQNNETHDNILRSKRMIDAEATKSLASAEPVAREAAVQALRRQSLGWNSLSIPEPEPLCWSVDAAREELTAKLADAGQTSLEKRAVSVAVMAREQAHVYLWLYTAEGVYSTLPSMQEAADKSKASKKGEAATITEGGEDSEDECERGDDIVSTWHRQSSLITQTIDLPLRALPAAMGAVAL